MRAYLQPGVTVEQAMNEFADAILDDRNTPDWVNNEGGRVEIRVDLMGVEPIVTVCYDTRIIAFEPAGTFYYHGVTVMPITEPTPDNAVEFAECPSDWDEIEGSCSMDDEDIL
jgi:hypothetical protein